MLKRPERGRYWSGFVELAGPDAGAGTNLANRWTWTSGPRQTNVLNENRPR